MYNVNDILNNFNRKDEINIIAKAVSELLTWDDNSNEPVTIPAGDTVRVFEIVSWPELEKDSIAPCDGVVKFEYKNGQSCETWASRFEFIE